LSRMEATSDQRVQIEFGRKFLPLIQPELSKYRIVFYHGGRGGGKSGHFARALLAHGRKRRMRILCTREIQNTIKDSVHKLLKDVIYEYDLSDYRVADDNITNSVTGSEFIFKGLHRHYMEIKSMEKIDICWIEEAQAISHESLKILQPTIRAEGSQIWVSMNRMFDSDPAWERWAKNPDPGMVFLQKVNYPDNPFFPDVLRRDMEKDKAEDYDTYLHVWEGEPMGDVANVVIKRRDVIAAMEREIVAEGGIEVGADIARFGDDKIVFYKRKGLKIIKEAVHRKKKVTETAALLMDFAGDRRIRTKVDDTGVGGGVTDILSDHNWNVVPVNFGGKAIDPDKYKNVASEMWFNFAGIIDQVDIPQDTELKEELSGRLYGYDPAQRKVVEKKDDFKKRFSRSPDKADALLLTFYSAKKPFGVMFSEEDFY
jgi:phage terminase large subunit